jgi:UDP-glucuronate 4-epimerase
MNFLVTGGAGFIGSHVCEALLDAGHAVWAFDDLNPFYDPLLKRSNIGEMLSPGRSFTFVQGDITDRAALDDLFGSTPFDQVIHLAARAGVRPSLETPASTNASTSKAPSMCWKARTSAASEDDHREPSPSA